MCTERPIVISSKSACPSDGKYAEFAAACCAGTPQGCKEQERGEAAWMEEQERNKPLHWSLETLREGHSWEHFPVFSSGS